MVLTRIRIELGLTDGFPEGSNLHGYEFIAPLSSDADDDEVFFKLDRHTLVKGAYVSDTEHDHVQRPFKIVDTAPYS